MRITLIIFASLLLTGCDQATPSRTVDVPLPPKSEAVPLTAEAPIDVDDSEPANPFDLLDPNRQPTTQGESKYRFTFPTFDPSRLPESGISVYDGDSIVVVRDLGEGRFDLRTCRIMRVDTPELRGSSDLEKQAANVVKQKVADWIAAIPAIHLRTVSYKLDKYGGRYDGDIFDERTPNEPLSKYLIENGLAKEYDGGTKAEWTDEELQPIIDAEQVQQ